MDLYLHSFSGAPSLVFIESKTQMISFVYMCVHWRIFDNGKNWILCLAHHVYRFSHDTRKKERNWGKLKKGFSGCWREDRMESDRRAWKRLIRWCKIMQNNNNMYSPLNTYEFLYHILGVCRARWGEKEKAIQCHMPWIMSRDWSEDLTAMFRDWKERKIVNYSKGLNVRSGL